MSPPQTRQTWSGRGKQPRWLADAIAAGQGMEIFAL
ncbi:H-NS family nucleoid-associated regulatory protein [Thiomonas arsenitoxydans]